MKKSLFYHRLSALLLALISTLSLASQGKTKLEVTASARLKDWKNPLTEWQNIAIPRIDSLKVDQEKQTISVYFASPLSYYPFREESVRRFTESLSASLGRKFRKYTVEVKADNYSLSQLIPNIFRTSLPVDSARFPLKNAGKPVLVRKEGAFSPEKGLSGKSIALWHSHGYYFEMNLDRWEWQRARLFGTVEDISVMSYVLPYLTKMLENAGANVFLPRERDIQTHEVIVDNDISTGASEVVLHLNERSRKINEGFLITDTLFPGVNPFRKGTSLQLYSDSAVYIPEIPSDGWYAVYISYPARKDNCSETSYIISHTGGKTVYTVNQTIGGETWIYLGTFNFKAGKNISTGSVTVRGKEGQYIGLDAIRFGGGMGIVARRPSREILKNRQSALENTPAKSESQGQPVSGFSWKLSGKPKFVEGARYWLQYAGFPDTLVYSPNADKNDYNDDYMSRSLWVNYLIADPYKSLNSSNPGGLGIPLDLSFALHTDAGVTPNDSIIGTLAIYSTGSDNGKFPEGTSRLASRDLSDIIQTRVVGDIRKIYNPDWTRRGIWDRPYYEARKPNVPAVLLELLSHQNLADQRYGLDPRFRFQVCRSIYKGILEYLSYTENKKFVVEPLPVKGFAIIPVEGRKIRLTWEPVTDSLEPSSAPDRYMLYKRIGDGGFDNGTIVAKPGIELELGAYDTIYSFKVTALNQGGESFDSEILSVGLKQDDPEGVLIVSGFDRICAPATFDIGNMAGVAWWDDPGVADHAEISFTGTQYDFNRKSPWLDDDAPGWGASYNDESGMVIPGNTFDYPYIHGKAIMAAGHSFFSVSNRYFTSEGFENSGWKTVDLLFGEEKSTHFFGDTMKTDFRIYTPGFMKRITGLAEAGTAIFMSGSYTGTDLASPGDSAAIKFAGKVLHFSPRTGHAVKSGNIYSTDYSKPYFSGIYDFNTGFSKEIYAAEAPDALEPYGKGAVCAFRYSENNSSAGVACKENNRTLILGFPFETIVNEKQRESLMKQILNFLDK